ncbi:hypothetical protein [Tolypothrix sp. VBCCA 56010]|uniref:hypothetical protein n=1 Tax=Tolypothrix sp. VBCCA 56010 TaxID=3137731 RepID=UPI003D7E552E
MAIPKKGSRLIVVDGDRYRWRIRRKITYSQCNGWGKLTFAVEHFDKSGATLIVKMPQGHPKNWTWEPIVPVLPCDVEYSIRQAIAKGWKPSEPGKVRTDTVPSKAVAERG